MSCSPTALSQMLEHQAETKVFNSNPYKSQFTIKVDTFLIQLPIQRRTLPLTTASPPPTRI